MASETEYTPNQHSEHAEKCGRCFGNGGHYKHHRGHPVLGESYEWTVWASCQCRLDEHYSRRYPQLPLPARRRQEAPTLDRRLFIVSRWEDFAVWLAPILYGAMPDPTPPKIINDEHVTRAYVTESSSGGVGPLVSYEGLLVLILGVASGNAATGEAVASAITIREHRPLWIYSPLPLADLPGKNFKWTNLERLIAGYTRRTLP